MLSQKTPLNISDKPKIKNIRLAIVYKHIRPDKNEVFYIGIGSNIKRAFQFNRGRNCYWKHIFEFCQNQIEVEILFEDLTWEEACRKEIELINFYGRKDLNKGSLVNLTDGGEGGFGRIVSENTKRKLSAGIKQKGHPMKGKTHTPEARGKIRESGKNRPVSKKTIDALRLANKNKKPTEKQLKALDRTGTIPRNARKIIDTKTGTIYNSIRELSDFCGIPKTSLQRYLSSDNNKTTYNFI